MCQEIGGQRPFLELQQKRSTVTDLLSISFSTLSRFAEGSAIVVLAAAKAAISRWTGKDRRLTCEYAIYEVIARLQANLYLLQL